MIAEKRMQVKINDKEYTLVFDVNTMCAYEEATGQFFLDACTEIMELIFPDGAKDESVKVNPFQIIKKISMVKLRALLWSAMHEYDKKDNPVWPLTIAQVGKLLDAQNIIHVFRSFLQGNAANQPSKETLGESHADVREMPLKDVPQQDPTSGGERSIELPASAFDSMKEKSDD